MRLKAMACFAVVCTAALAGCGTVGNCVNVKGKPARAIYGGVRRDALEGTNHLNEAFVGPAPSFSKVPQPPDAARDFAVKTVCAGWGAALLAVDLPLSAVADTLTLPVTVPATLLQKKPNAKGHPQPNRQAKVMKVPAPAAPPSPPTLPKPPHSSYGGQ
jgi:uncharacterized protein YceK